MFRVFKLVDDHIHLILILFFSLLITNTHASELMSCERSIKEYAKTLIEFNQKQKKLNLIYERKLKKFNKDKVIYEKAYKRYKNIAEDIYGRKKQKRLQRPRVPVNAKVGTNKSYGSGCDFRGDSAYYYKNFECIEFTLSKPSEESKPTPQPCDIEEYAPQLKTEYQGMTILSGDIHKIKLTDYSFLDALGLYFPDPEYRCWKVNCEKFSVEFKWFAKIPNTQKGFEFNLISEVGLTKDKAGVSYGYSHTYSAQAYKVQFNRGFKPKRIPSLRNGVEISSDMLSETIYGGSITLSNLNDYGVKDRIRILSGDFLMIQVFIQKLSQLS